MSAAPRRTAYYASMVYQSLGLRTAVITCVAAGDEDELLSELRGSGVEVFNLPTRGTTVFRNYYAADNPDIRIQSVISQAEPIDLARMPCVPARIFHLGPLTQQDMDPEIPRSCAKAGTLVALDAQGLTRSVVDGRVVAAPCMSAWQELPYIQVLKADLDEVLALTGQASVLEAVRIVTQTGVREVIITRGSHGSTVYGRGRSVSFEAIPPRATIDATGCGDTYLAAYMARRLVTDSLEDCAKHAALAASLNIETPGPFTGTWADIAESWQAFCEASGSSLLRPLDREGEAGRADHQSSAS
jgi:sugar/nucleoside kinase (ribokinase family)